MRFWGLPGQVVIGPSGCHAGIGLPDASEGGVARPGPVGPAPFGGAMPEEIAVQCHNLVARPAAKTLYVFVGIELNRIGNVSCQVVLHE